MSDANATSLYPALLAAQRSMGKVKKDASNPAFRTKYATLQSVLETIEGPLADNGLVLVQRLQYDRIGVGRDTDRADGTPILVTQLIHAASGEAIDSVIAVVCKDPLDPQKVGGALTYYRRYSLLALLGLAPEDDDGNSAAQPRQQHDARQGQRNGSARPAPAQQAREAPALPPPPQPEPLTDEQERIVAQAWDMADAHDTYQAVAALIKTTEPHATPGQWAAIKQRFMAIRRKHYPDTMTKKEVAR